MSDKPKKINNVFLIVNTFIAAAVIAIFFNMTLHSITSIIASWYLDVEVTSDINSYYTGSQKTTSFNFYARNMENNRLVSANAVIFFLMTFLSYVLIVGGAIFNEKYNGRSFHKDNLKIVLPFLVIFVVILLMIKLDSSGTIVNYLLF